MTHCGQCGQENPATNVYCGRCGRPLQANAVENDALRYQKQTAQATRGLGLMGLGCLLFIGGIILLAIVLVLVALLAH